MTKRIAHIGLPLTNCKFITVNVFDLQRRLISRHCLHQGTGIAAFQRKWCYQYEITKSILKS